MKRVESAAARRDPAIQETIDDILGRVRDPESGLSVAALGLVRRVRVSAEHRHVYLDAPFDTHTPTCLACAGIAMTIIQGIRRELVSAFEEAFPEYTIEFM
ncbi:MAG: iron-sulfur cluster assembly protein [Spirochaetales bacterium]|nr:iron-sulfur cluster assembly protein [Spirochaetales bacterium]